MSSLPVTSDQIPWYDFNQSNYSALNSPWRPWMNSNYTINDYVEYNDNPYYPIERESTPPSKRMRLQNGFSYYNQAINQQKPPVIGSAKQIDITNREYHGFNGLLQDEQSSVFASTGLLPYPVYDPQHSASVGENFSPSYGNMFIPPTETIYEIVEEDGTTTQKSTILQPDGSQTPLCDWQCTQDMKQDDQPLNSGPSFKSISTFAGSGVPTRRRGRPGKNSTCHLCNKTFEGNYKLKLHMNSHTGEKPFVCQICKKAFSRGPTLNQHLRIHFAAAFSCKYCDRSFRNPADRLVHVLTQACTRRDRHLSQTPHGWICISCDDKSFSTKEQAERHARSHEQGKGMLCPVCNHNFQGEKPNVLIRHVKKQHREYIPSLEL